MKKLLVATVLALAWLTVVPVAFSQVNDLQPNQPLPRTQSTVNLTVEQQHTLKELLKDASAPDETGNAPMSVGDTVPESVKLYPMPEMVANKVPQVKAHLFFKKDGHIVLVSAKDRKVADVID